jgi:hypothetical protein
MHVARCLGAVHLIAALSSLVVGCADDSADASLRAHSAMGEGDVANAPLCGNGLMCAGGVLAGATECKQSETSTMTIWCCPLGATFADGKCSDAAPAAPTQSSEKTVVRVLNLVFDPIIESQGGKRLRELQGWNDPATLTQGYVADLAQASHGLVEYQIVETLVVDAYPPQRNGVAYDDGSFLACVATGYRQCAGDGTSYPGVIAQYGLADKVKSGAIDEVFMWGAPGMGFWESMMAGPGAYWINGPSEPQIDSGRVFAIMGFNYERGVAEMLEDLGHRMESTMARVYGSWDRNQSHAWNRFTALDVDQPGAGGIGNAHNAVNATTNSGYDRDNGRSVSSSADDWYAYPNMTGARTDVTSAAWTAKFPRDNATRSYLVWWFDHVPHAEGRAPDGKLANWWLYFANHERYKDEHQ